LTNLEVGAGRGSSLVDDLQRRLLVERVDGVGADAQPLLQFPLDRLGRRQDRPEAQAGERLQPVQALRGEQPAGGDFDLVVDAAQREQFVAQQESRRKQRQHRPIGLELVEFREAHAVFLRQPAQHALLGLRFGPGVLAQVRPRVGRGELAPGDEALEQFGQRAGR